MTYREFYNAVIAGQMNEEMVTFATEAITKLDNRNASRTSKPSKTALANEPIKVAIVDYLTALESHSAIAKDIAEALNLTTAKASSLCGQLAKEEKVVVSEVKIPKVGKRLAYTLA